MSWVKLDDQARQHRKLLAVGASAAWLWVCGLMYCNSQKAKDGFIPDEAVAVLYPIANPRKEVEKLVRAGLWERVDGGYRVHDYHDYQPTSEQSRDVSEVRAAAGRAGGLRSGESRRSRRQALDEATAEADAKQIASKQSEADAKHDASLLPKPVPSRPDPVHGDPPVVPHGGTMVGAGAPDVSRPEPVSRGVAGYEREFWIQAYTEGVIAGGADAAWTFRPQAYPTLVRITAHCPTDHRSDILGWIRRTAHAFVEATKADAAVWSGFSADGMERWLNSGRPSAKPRAAMPPAPASSAKPKIPPYHRDLDPPKPREAG